MSILQRLKMLIASPLHLARYKGGQRVFLLIGTFSIIYVFLTLSIMPMGVAVEVGMPSPETIDADQEVVDPYTTNELRQEAASAVPEVYDRDPSVAQEGRDVLLDFFSLIREARGKEGEAGEIAIELRGKIREELPLEGDFPRDSLVGLLEMEQETLAELQNRLENVFDEYMEEGIKEDEVETVRRQINQEISLLPFGPEVRQSAEKLINPLIRPNMFYNEEATEAQREAARQAVEPVKILERSLIVQEGEIVTERHIAQLEALGKLGTRAHIGGYIGLFVLLVLIFAVVLLYLYFFNREIYDNITYLSLLSLILVLTLVMGLAARYFSGYLIPVATSAILITVLFESRLAVFINVIIVLFLGIVMEGEFNYIVVALLGSFVAIYSVSTLQHRSDLTKAGVYVAGMNMVAIISIFLLMEGFHLEYDYLREFSIGVLAGVGSGLLSAVLAIGLLPYLENTFGLTSAITLLELADPGRPLLRRLLMEAPGTYHHSIVVGNLAEAAAEAVDADPLMCRVAAFYHDTGKIRRPYFFVENQLTGHNPHKRISPNLSSLIIRSHVKDGAEMARKEKLPQPIIEIIQQHHGNSLVSFFYLQALNDGKAAELSDEEFRYEGPLPQSKEAAIILLADAVEAAVRSLSRPVSGRIEGMVRRIIKEKLNDGQLDEAPLTLKDLDKIGDTFVYILSGIFHQRIEYPEKELRADLERGKNKKDESNDK